MTMDIQTESVMIVSVPHSDLSFCAKQGPRTWRLLDDGFSVSWKLHQDKVNKARALVYERKRNLVPPGTDAPTGRIYSIRSLFAAWQDRVVATSVPKREREQ